MAGVARAHKPHKLFTYLELIGAHAAGTGTVIVLDDDAAANLRDAKVRWRWRWRW